MNPPNKHHYIPAFYLKNWAGSDKKICQWSRPFNHEVKPLRIHPNGTGFLDRLYELRHYESELAQQIEQNFFQPVDTLASQVLHEAQKNDGRIDWAPEKRSAWTRFIVSLLLRCPEDIETFREVWQRDFFKVDKRAQQEYESIRKEADPKLFSDYLRARPVQEQKRHFFNLYLSMFNSKPTGDFINNMKWRFWRVETDDYEFYTSDRPIVKTNGLRSPRGHLLIPVAPNFVFLAASSDEVFRDIISLKPKLLIKEANRIVVGGAVKFAYSTKDDCGKFMRNNFGTKPQPRIAATMTF